MVVFETNRIVDTIMDFVKTCPFLDEFGIDLTPTSTQRLVTAKPDGSALDYVGSNLITDLWDINKRRETIRQANFQLWLLRKSNHEAYRKDIADFLFNFEMWVEHCQAYGLTPKISKRIYEEVMWADNGVYFAEWDGKTASLYTTQIHIRYYTDYQ